MARNGRAVGLAVVVAALGYFVDIYDLLLFSIIRVGSLRGLHVPEPDILSTGVLLLNAQMSGMLIGGIAWGILGDRRGRLSVLFGSIILYSLANIGNGLVTSVPAYAIVRFVAGVGLAGELGAGITLVSETMRKETRGYGTALVATVGVSGAVVAAIVGNKLQWRTAYFIGGGLGIALLGLRIGVLESGMFQQVRGRAVSRGNFFMLFRSPRRAWRYIAVILVGVPIWYVVGILVTFAPEIGGALGMKPAPNASRAVLFCYTGLIAGDMGSGALSQLLRSRKKVIATFILLTTALVALYFTMGSTSLATFYAICGALGVATGYWAVFVTIASEQFGTNIRATVTTTTPNFVRGAVVLLTSGFQALKGVVGVASSAKIVGALTIALALVALAGLEETFGKDLDFIEE